jgi:tetratricopeptide (TPR) repeat protein
VQEARVDLSYSVMSDLTLRPALWAVVRWRLKHGERTGNGALNARTYLRLADLSSRLGVGGLGHSLLRLAVDHARAAGEPRTLASLLGNLAAKELAEDLVTAHALAAEALALAVRCGDPRIQWFARNNLAIASWTSGEWAEFPEELTDETEAGLSTLVALATSRAPVERSSVSSNGEPYQQLWGQFAGALALQAQGDVSSCLRQGRAAVSAFVEYMGIVDDFVHFFAHLSRLAWSADDEALSWLTVQVDEAGDAIPLALRAHRRHVAGLVADRDGDAEAAESSYLEAIELFGRWGAVPAEARAHADLGVLLHRTGRADEAEEHLTLARKVLTRLGATAWTAELDAALAGEVVSR